MRTCALISVLLLLLGAGCGKKQPQLKFVATPSGLQYADEKVGAGAEAAADDVVTVHYKGWLDNGKVFDHSRKPGGEPVQFRIGTGGVIKGWEEGITGMRAGGVRQLIIPPKLGYADEEQGAIPPNSTLHFQIELLSITKSGT